MLRAYARSGFLFERPARRPIGLFIKLRSIKKPSVSGKSENEGIRRTPPRTRVTGWPHPSLVGEVGPIASIRCFQWDHDEHNRVDILTSGVKTSPPPSRSVET